MYVEYYGCNYFFNSHIYIKNGNEVTEQKWT